MKTTKLKLNTPCPCCEGQLHPQALSCISCGTEIKGPIATNPLMKLSDDMLHFLMVFIHCGGKISDMEKALGVSYPTVKAKLSELQKLVAVTESETLNKQYENNIDVMNILAEMEAGNVDYATALSKIKQLKK
ncbi:MAG: DUF2089 family protein [Deltaproteobacteria bacterium]|nr:MAG: DUF2089 family protein [Deltaproteobacteria bacterium]TNF29836.1 MAG: DUF2089 family protein [Deltaproteobacteria bacterium]